ncbi:MAG: ADP-ribosylglycohydrolase family protein, partial [Promethearchaeota archaeon]
EGQFGYDLNKTLDEIRPSYQFDVSCQGTVPPAIRAFLESKNFEDAIRNAISIGGDSDTLTCITGGIAEAFYGNGVPDQVRSYVETKLDTKLLDILNQFTQRFMVPDEIVR